MEKEHKKLQDVLPVGTHKIRVFPKREWNKEEGAFIEGSHRKTTTGSWMYSTNVNNEWITIFANDDQKRFFATGEVLAVIKPLKNKFSGKNEVDAQGKEVLRAYFNEVKQEVTVKEVEEIFAPGPVSEPFDSATENITPPF